MKSNMEVFKEELNEIKKDWGNISDLIVKDASDRIKHLTEKLDLVYTINHLISLPPSKVTPEVVKDVKELIRQLTEMVENK